MIKMKKLLYILIFVATANAYAQKKDSKPLTIGEVRTIHSNILNEKRTLNIYLPNGYDSARKYPVMYVLDGGIGEDFLHITGLVQFFSMTFNMPDCIVVGITNVDRRRDFTHATTDAGLRKDYPTSGQSAKFIDFIETELQSFVQKNYNTTSDKFIIGQSLGGLLATEILLKKPQLFTHYLIVSPSLWWDDETLLNGAAGFLKISKHAPQYVYIAVGDGEHPQMVSGAEKLNELLCSNKPSIKTDFYKMKDENHATILHNGIYKAFSLLFPYKG